MPVGEVHLIKPKQPKRIKRQRLLLNLPKVRPIVIVVNVRAWQLDQAPIEQSHLVQSAD
jgi:hypothetical protein